MLRYFFNRRTGQCSGFCGVLHILKVSVQHFDLNLAYHVHSEEIPHSVLRSFFSKCSSFPKHTDILVVEGLCSIWLVAFALFLQHLASDLHLLVRGSQFYVTNDAESFMQLLGEVSSRLL